MGQVILCCTKLVANLYLGTRGSNVPVWYLDVRPSLWVFFPFQNRVPSSMLPVSPVPSSLTNGQQNSAKKKRASTSGHVITWYNDLWTTARFFNMVFLKWTQKPVILQSIPLNAFQLHIQQNLLLSNGSFSHTTLCLWICYGQIHEVTEEGSILLTF